MSDVFDIYLPLPLALGPLAYPVGGGRSGKNLQRELRRICLCAWWCGTERTTWCAALITTLIHWGLLYCLTKLQEAELNNIQCVYQ